MSWEAGGLGPGQCLGNGGSISSQSVPLGLTSESPFGNQKVDWERLGVLQLEKLGENPYGEEASDICAVRGQAWDINRPLPENALHEDRLPWAWMEDKHGKVTFGPSARIFLLETLSSGPPTSLFLGTPFFSPVAHSSHLLLVYPSWALFRP